MINIDKILNDFGLQLSERLRADIEQKQIQRQTARGSLSASVNASGKLRDSVRYTVQNYKLTIISEDYIRFLEQGRAPGKRPPKAVIRKWIDDKGINPTDISKDSLAYIIAKRIGEEGTSIYKAGGSDLVSSIFNEQLQREIEQSFENLIATEIQSEIINLAA